MISISSEYALINISSNKMDAGQLVTVDRPYHLHKTIRSMLPSASLVAASRGIQVKLDLDERIDLVARRAILAQNGLPDSEIQERLADPKIPNDGLIAGDEMRMRQIVSNFITNAIKFNRPGPDSHITVRTKLIQPTVDFDALASPQSTTSMTSIPDELSKTSDLAGHKEKDGNYYARRLDSIVVRIEVQDTGKYAAQSFGYKC